MTINKISLGTAQFGLSYGIHPLSKQVEFNEIKIVFVAACHSENIGKIFFEECGIPIVIAVNEFQ